MKLSKRLEAIKDFVNINTCLADIGTDHAFVPIKLILENKIRKAIAMDINKGPLEKAKNNISHYNLNDKIETRLSNGLRKLKENEADTILIAGMGSDLIINILKDGDPLKYSTKEYILSPHSHWHKLRAFLRENSYQIIEEKMLTEDNKYYVIIRAVFNSQLKLEENYKYDLYGEYLIKNKDSILIEFLYKKRDEIQKILSNLSISKGQNVEKRILNLKKEIQNIEEILYEMQGLIR